MPRIHLSACPLCQSSDTDLYRTVIDRTVSGESFRLERCHACGFIFTQDTPSDDNIGSYYQSESYVAHSDTRTGFINHCFHLVRQLTLRQKLRLIKRTLSRKTGSLLDVGTGTGYFMHHMQKNGWRVSGIEADAGAREFAKEQFDLDILSPECGNELPDESLDVITLWHVLEHLRPLEWHVGNYKKWLRKDGILVFALPNSASYDADIYKNKWAAWDAPRHLWHFNQATVDALMKQHGFEPVKIKTMPFDAFYIAMLSETGKGIISKLRPLAVGLTGWFLSIFSRRFSSSLTYVYKRI